LIKAYLKSARNVEALDEARRALTMLPDPAPVEELLRDPDAAGSLPGVSVILCRAAVTRNPTDVPAWIALGDAYAADQQPGKAVDAYLQAVDVAPQDPAPHASLATCYAAQEQYDKCLNELQLAPAPEYAVVVKIVSDTADNLLSEVGDAQSAFEKGGGTREQFYERMKKDDGRTNALADFLGKLPAQKQSNLPLLHRKLGANLLAQATSEWLAFIETAQDNHKSQADVLMIESQDEFGAAAAVEKMQEAVSGSAKQAP
jgi:tetratricopeptide (TPR) repeat protein